MSQKLAIVGVANVWGPQPGRSRRAIATEVARLAIEDAGLKRSDIDGAIEMAGEGGLGIPTPYSDPFPRPLGLPIKFYFKLGRGGAQAGLGIAAARSFLEQGIANYVVLAIGKDGWNQSQRAKEVGGRGLTLNVREGYWGSVLGDLQAVSHHSWMASRHMSIYGTTSEQLGAIAVQTRAWAAMNPEAVAYGRPITIEDHQSSPYVVEPYHLLDISRTSDGGVGIVVTTAERAKDHAKPVYVLGQGFGEVLDSLWWQKLNFQYMAVKTAKEQAFGHAKIELGDIDCAQLYDCFTSEVLFQLEDYGWAPKGEGGAFVAEGHIGPGGDIPVNTGGGLLSSYHLSDCTGFLEAVRQLRGEVPPERQVPNCEIAISTGHGGELVSPGMCSMHTCTVMGNELR